MNKKIGMRIKNRREELGITQEELALKSGYTSKSSIAHVESGRATPPIDKLLLISKCLNCSLIYLMGLDENPQSKEAQWFNMVEKLMDAENSAESKPTYGLTKPAVEIIQLLKTLPENEQWKLVGRIEAYVEGLSKVLNKGEPNEKV